MQVLTKELKLPLQKRRKWGRSLVTLEKAKRKCFNEVHVVSDAKEVIRALKGDDDRSIRSIISDIKGLASLFSFIDLFFYT